MRSRSPGICAWMASGSWPGMAIPYQTRRPVYENHVRTHTYTVNRPVVEDDDPTLTVASDQGPEEALSSAQDEWEIGEALARLPDEQREVLRGAYFRGRTMRELADEQRVALGTVKTRVRLALDRLRQMLKGRDGP